MPRVLKWHTGGVKLPTIQLPIPLPPAVEVDVVEVKEAEEVEKIEVKHKALEVKKKDTKDIEVKKIEKIDAEKKDTEVKKIDAEKKDTEVKKIEKIDAEKIDAEKKDKKDKKDTEDAKVKKIEVKKIEEKVAKAKVAEPEKKVAGAKKVTKKTTPVVVQKIVQKDAASDPRTKAAAAVVVDKKVIPAKGDKDTKAQNVQHVQAISAKKGLKRQRTSVQKPKKTKKPTTLLSIVLKKQPKIIKKIKLKPVVVSTPLPPSATTSSFPPSVKIPVHFTDLSPLPKPSPIMFDKAPRRSSIPNQTRVPKTDAPTSFLQSLFGNLSHEKTTTISTKIRTSSEQIKEHSRRHYSRSRSKSNSRNHSHHSKSHNYRNSRSHSRSHRRKHHSRSRKHHSRSQSKSQSRSRSHSKSRPIKPSVRSRSPSVGQLKLHQKPTEKLQLDMDELLAALDWNPPTSTTSTSSTSSTSTSLISTSLISTSSASTTLATSTSLGNAFDATQIQINNLSYSNMFTSLVEPSKTAFLFQRNVCDLSVEQMYLFDEFRGCSECNFITKNSEAERDHVCHAEITYIQADIENPSCRDCGFRFKTSDAQIMHEHSIAAKRQFTKFKDVVQCHVCGVFVYRLDAAKHYDIHFRENSSAQNSNAWFASEDMWTSSLPAFVPISISTSVPATALIEVHCGQRSRTLAETQLRSCERGEWKCSKCGEVLTKWIRSDTGEFVWIDVCPNANGIIHIECDDVIQIGFEQLLENVKKHRTCLSEVGNWACTVCHESLIVWMCIDTGEQLWLDVCRTDANSIMHRACK